VYRYARREPLPLRLKEYPREGVLRRAGFWLGNCYGDESQGAVSLLGTLRRAAIICQLTKAAVTYCAKPWF
jgi:hypothetical protein